MSCKCNQTYSCRVDTCDCREDPLGKHSGKVVYSSSYMRRVHGSADSHDILRSTAHPKQSFQSKQASSSRRTPADQPVCRSSRARCSSLAASIQVQEEHYRATAGPQRELETPISTLEQTSCYKMPGCISMTSEMPTSRHSTHRRITTWTPGPEEGSTCRSATSHLGSLLYHSPPKEVIPRNQNSRQVSLRRVDKLRERSVTIGSTDAGIRALVMREVRKRRYQRPRE